MPSDRPEPDPGTRRGRLSEPQLVRLLELGRMLVAELDLEAVLRQVLEAARDLTAARYVALGVLDDTKKELKRFLVLGIDDETRTAIGPPPRGRGVLGELIREAKPLRLANVRQHPRSYGFPPGHPSMTAFLGVPILIRGEAWGNLYLTQKAGGAEFDQTDEDLVTVLAEWAAVAIANARLYERLERRGSELQRAVTALEANVDISRAVAREPDTERILELIVKRGRALIGAETVAIMLPEEAGELIVAAAAGAKAAQLEGRTISSREPHVRRLFDSGAQALTEAIGPGEELASISAACVLLAPLSLRPQDGVLAAFDRPGGEHFGRAHELLFGSFSATAGTAILTSRAAERRELHLSMQASENERRRWARELHDETLQELGALKFILETATELGEPEASRSVDRGVEHVERAILNLEALITELRPAALDELGLGPALEVLARRLSDVSGVAIDLALLADFSKPSGSRLRPELEDTIYRLVQEAVNNALKHAQPNRISVSVEGVGAKLVIRVSDDGAGFVPEQTPTGFGLVGMRERVALSSGRLAIESEPGGGTEVRAELAIEPATSPAPAAGQSPAARLG